MKTIWLVIFGFISVNSIGAQELKHAPTVEQCRADQELWLSKLDAESILLIDFRELNDWSREMRQCMAVDQKFEDRYYNTVAEANFAKARRFANFLDRHNLYEQFLTEDAQGQGR
jgi:hypothetical protein